MRAEAEGDGQLGMLLVGNVGVNRVRAGCLDFNDIRNLQDMVFQSPGGLKQRRKGIFINVPVKWIEIWQDASLTASVSRRANDHYGFSCLKAIARLSGITNGTPADSSHTVSIPQRLKTARMCNSKEERMK